MASRKYKPALFELVNRGPLKPNSQGSIKPPRWFYGGKRRSKAAAAKDREISAHSSDAGPGMIAGDGTPAPESAFSAAIGSQLQITLPYWALVVVALGLILLLVVAYSLGLRAGQGDTSKGLFEDQAALREAEPTAGLNDIRQGPVRQGLAQIESPTMVATPVTGAAEAPASSTPAAAAGASANRQPTTTPARSGQSLVMCSDDTKGSLEPVREYFVGHGVGCAVGWDGHRYVLCSDQTVESNRDAQAIQLKKLVDNIGKTYNSNRPDGAPSFTPSTFAGAYWANAQDIRLVDK